MSDEHLYRLKGIFESAIDGIITINPKGIMDSVNPAASKLFGYTEDEMIGQSVNILMPEPHHTNHDEYVRNYLKTGKKKIIGIGRHLLGKKKDGSTFPMYLSVSEVKYDGVISFTGIIHDTTDITEAENKLKELNNQLEDLVAERTQKLTEVVNKLLYTNNKLENEIDERAKVEMALKQNQDELKQALETQMELNDLKTKFVSMASHEFKTPLSTIMSSASLIGNYTSTEQQEKREKHIDKIKNSIRSLNSILTDFLSIEKLETKKTSAKPTAFDLNDLIQEVFESFKYYPHCDHPLELVTEMQRLEITQDKALLEQILVNLLSNACKYSERGKLIQIELNEKDNNRVSLAVIDQGVGIPKDEQQYMFERFYRASNAQHIPGTGLGLNIISYKLELIHGDISFESTPGKGSTFVISFPKTLNDED